jgi:aminopeptidase N
MPLMVPSSLMRGTAYRIASYNRPAAAYQALRDLLGDDLFKKAMHEFVEKWNGKHPGPYDFFYSFNKVTGQNLNWFWKPWFFNFAYPDLAVKKVESSGDEVTVIIGKVGEIPVPVNLVVNYEDDSEETIHKKASVWKSGNPDISIVVKNDKKVTEVYLDTSKHPDVNKENNTGKL